MNKIDLLIAPQTKAFVKLCRQYYEYLEELPDKNVSDFWTTQLSLLSAIYADIFKLPQINMRYSSEVEKFVLEREYNQTFIRLVTYVGALDRYADFSDLSHPGSVKVIEASLSEMLTDIFQELKDFVLLYDTGTLENMNDAIAECIDTFGRYWGVKLLSAMRIIHVNLFHNRYAESKKSSSSEDDDLDEEIIDDGDYDDEMD